MRLLILCLGLALSAAAGAQSWDPPSMLLLREPYGEHTEVRMVSSQFAPNTSSPWHVHPSAVAVYVEVGSGLWEIEGRPPRTLVAGQAILEPANLRSRVSNVLPAQILKLVSFQTSDPARPFSVPAK